MARERVQQVASHLARGRVTSVAIARQRSVDHVLKLVWQIDEVRERRDRILAHGPHARGHVLAREEPLTREAFPEHHAERPHVDAAIRGLAFELLGREVRELALHLAGRGLVVAMPRARDAEVEHPRGSVVADEEVLRAHVAVHDLEELTGLVTELVRGVQAFARVDHEPRDHPRALVAERGGRARGLAEHAVQRLTHEIRHREVVDALDLAELVHAADVRVVDARRDARLVEEHRREAWVAREVRVDALERDELLEAAWALRLREEHGAHAAARELVAEHVGPEASRRAQRRDVSFVAEGRVGHASKLTRARACGGVARTVG